MSIAYLIGLFFMIIGTIFVVSDTLVKNHSHLHTHLITHTHDGSTHTHTITHEHSPDHFLSTNVHTHHHAHAILKEKQHL